MNIADLLSEALDQFESRIERFEASLQGKNGAVADGVRPEFAQMVDDLMSALRQVEAEAKKQRVQIEPFRVMFRRRASVWFLRGNLNLFSFQKPFGYAGDFKILDMIYCFRPADNGIQRLMDFYFHDEPAAQAVLQRRDYVVRWISHRRAEVSPEKRLVIASIGAGPCRDIKQLLQRAELQNATLILTDSEEKGLQHGKNVIGKVHESVTVETRCEDIVDYYRKANKQSLADRFGTEIDLAYSIGVMDYVRDGVLEAMIRLFYDALRPGGQCCIGNFDPSNPSRTYMEWVLDWNIHYRSKRKLRSIAKRALPVDTPMRVDTVDNEVNNLLMFKKPDAMT